MTEMRDANRGKHQFEVWSPGSTIISQQGADRAFEAEAFRQVLWTKPVRLAMGRD